MKKSLLWILALLLAFGLAVSVMSCGGGGDDDTDDDIDDDTDDTDDDVDDDIDDDTEEPPAAPSDLQATAVSDEEIDLTWTDNSDNEDGFKLERQGGDKQWEEIATLDPDTTSYQDTGLECGTKYTYRVYAFNDAGNSDYSNEASATTDECTHGNVLEFNDPSTAAYALVDNVFNQSDINGQLFTFEFDWYWQTGGEGGGLFFLQNFYGSYWVEFAIVLISLDLKGKGNPKLMAFNGSDYVICAEPIDLDTWLHITVEVNPNYPTSCSYSVLLNDATTPCTDLGFIWCDAPLEKLSLLAFSDVNGGVFRVDNLDFYHPTKDTSFFTEDWEDDTAGSPPGAPWTYTPGGATATVVDID